ncbi:MAG: SH3 domain-containing protein [Chloroflexi bacterium]|nr:SH3 domain-containing protein [Chloroflexota bacterium]
MMTSTHVFSRVALGAVLTVIALGLVITPARSQDLAAAVMVLADEVLVLRSGTREELALPPGAVAPIGPGDRVRTTGNGRAFVTFQQINRLLLLPDSTYELVVFAQTRNDEVILEGVLSGIAVQQFGDDPARWAYQLAAARHNVTAPSALFAVWAQPGELEAVISASGSLTVTTADEMIAVPAGAGVATRYGSTPILLEPPLHAAQLVALAIDCQGVIATTDGLPLRLRQGAALDYPIVDGLESGAVVNIAGTTQNELWYRIPFQSGFGWLFRRFVAADCSRLPRFPDLVGEETEQIELVTEAELDLLAPFYGSPSTNPIFYR